jgi:hypothetical protein
VRGGLDDALDKLARRDELRRRAAGEAPGTPPAVTELVEAVAAVVARHPELAITMGVEGAGDPVLLHFAIENGVVQVSADNSLAARAAQDPPPSTRPADFDIDLEAAEEVHPAQPTQRLFEPATHHRAAPEGPVTGTGDRDQGHRPYQYDAARQYQATGSYEPEPYDDEPYDPQTYEPVRYATDPYDQGPATARTAEQPRYADPEPAPRPMPAPLPEPIPLRMEPGETEVAARRLAALLRADPSLLHPTPRD